MQPDSSGATRTSARTVPDLETLLAQKVRILIAVNVPLLTHQTAPVVQCTDPAALAALTEKEQRISSLCDQIRLLQKQQAQERVCVLVRPLVLWQLRCFSVTQNCLLTRCSPSNPSFVGKSIATTLRPIHFARCVTAP